MAASLPDQVNSQLQPMEDLTHRASRGFLQGSLNALGQRRTQGIKMKSRHGKHFPSRSKVCVKAAEKSKSGGVGKLPALT